MNRAQHKDMMQKIGMLMCLCVSVIAFGAPATAAEGGMFDVAMVSYNDDAKFVAIKYDRSSGETWILSPDGFKAIPEKQELAPSEFIVQLTAVRQGWYGLRIDTKSGRTWTVQDGMWVEQK